MLGASTYARATDGMPQVLPEVSRRNLQRPIRFVIDGVIVTEPTFQEPLLEGKALISGQLRLEEAGPLPVGLEVSESKP